MERCVRTTVLVLKNYHMGEQHRGVVLLSPDLGVVRAVAFGARNPKGRLAAFSFPFKHLEVWLYHQPIHDSWKLSDAKELEGFAGIQEEIARFYTASLWSEILLASHAGGDPAAAYRVLLEGLLLLQNWPETEIRGLNLQFCLRWLVFLGLPWEKSTPACLTADRSSRLNGSKEGPGGLHLVEDAEFSAWLERGGAAGLGQDEPPSSDAAHESVVFRRLTEILGKELLTLKSWAAIMP